MKELEAEKIVQRTGIHACHMKIPGLVPGLHAPPSIQILREWNKEILDLGNPLDETQMYPAKWKKISPKAPYWKICIKSYSEMISPWERKQITIWNW